MDKTVIRDAATVIVLRSAADSPAVLMGQRGANAAFMPNKFVFPGGAVDAGDADVPLFHPVGAPCRERLAGAGPEPGTIAAAAIRELWEETGLVLGKPARWTDPAPDWMKFAETGHRPDAAPLRFVFRAITPPGRPRRFDARFFLVDAAQIAGDLDDFSLASDELRHLQWVPLHEARRFDLPFITEIVLADIAMRLPDLSAPTNVPFFKNDDEDSAILALGPDPWARDS
ncbi:MAG: NUDIX hydrolase [Pseudomonadota bacterium]